MGKRSNYSQNHKTVRWIVTRIVREKYDVEAHSREHAMQIIGDRGNPHEVIIIKETAFKAKK